MRISAVRCGMLLVVLVVLTLIPSASSSAQDLAVLRAGSLNKVLTGVEEVSRATGQPVSREMVMGMATEVFGRDPSEFLDLDRPTAIAMPAEGMMLQQDGVVAAVPVTDVGAAMEALTARFPTHTVDGELHTFTSEEGPSLYVIASEDYVRLGANADLVTRTNPLEAGGSGSDLSLEIYLEPVAPMIEANLSPRPRLSTVQIFCSPGGQE